MPPIRLMRKLLKTTKNWEIYGVSVCTTEGNKLFVHTALWEKHEDQKIREMVLGLLRTLQKKRIQKRLDEGVIRGALKLYIDEWGAFVDPMDTVINHQPAFKKPDMINQRL